nr:hypothetical protein [uncultured Anaerobutyricum sp.]
MSITMILNILTENRTMLIEAVLGNILNCIVVYTLFGKRKYAWFFPAACGVRYIFYNIGLLSIWNAMYGTQNWYKITMSTCASLTAVGLVILTAFVWKEPLAKVLTGVFATECINDGILYQGMRMKLSLLQECLTVILIFIISYAIVHPILKKYCTYTIKHEVICLTIVFTYLIGGWMSNFLYNTSASLRQKPMYLLATSLCVGSGSALVFAFAIHTRNVFRKKKELEQNQKQMENYYKEIQHEIKELDDFKATVEGALDELTDLSSNLSQKEKKKQVKAYIDNLQTRYQNLNQLFFCEDYLVDGILTDFAAFCKQQQIEVDILFQNYHRGNIKSEDSIAILLKLIEYAKQAKKVKLHAAAIKNQLVYSVELQGTNLKVSPRAFKKYVKRYDGGINVESRNGEMRIILGLRR